MPNTTGKSDSAGASIFSTATSVAGVAADQLGVVALAVEQRDVDFAGAVDHVEVGQDVALPVDDDAAALAFRWRSRTSGSPVGLHARGVDVDHAAVDVLVDRHVDPLLGRQFIEGRGDGQRGR